MKSKSSTTLVNTIVIMPMVAYIGRPIALMTESHMNMATGIGKKSASTRMKVTPSSRRTSLPPIMLIRVGERTKTAAPMIQLTMTAKTSPVRKASLAVFRSPSPSFIPMVHWHPTQTTMAKAIRNP